MDDETAAVIIGGDEIDVLIDMSVPANDSRAALIAMNPSIVQLGYLNNNFGLGVPGITHIVSDPMTNAALENAAGEGQKVIQNRPGLFAVEPSFMLAAPTPPPALESGDFVIGAPLDLEGLDERSVKVFAEISEYSTK